MAFDIEEF